MEHKSLIKNFVKQKKNGYRNKVYLCWYDFQKKTENVCKGEVVDNSLWDDTKWQGYVNVLFQPPHSVGPFCHHFPENKLSLTPDDVPHDDCYLVCGKKSRFYEHDTTNQLKNDGKYNPSDAWQRVQQFKQEHWDYQHGHLSIDALDEYYQMWHDAIAAKRGYQPTATVPCNSVAGVVPSPVSQNETPTVTLPSHTEPTASAPKLTRKQKLSTGSITYNDSIQTSFFD